MALTLIEAAKVARNEGKEIKAGVIEMFARASDLLAALPFKDIQGNAYQYNREGVLPAVAFRNVNGTYTASTGVVNPFVEALRICGGELDVDTFIVKTQGVQARAVQESMKVKALAAEITRVLIKGDSTTAESAEFDGLQTRLPIGVSQAISNGSTSGGDPLSLLKLDEMIDSLTNGGTKVLVMNKTMRRRLTVAARTSSVAGNIDYVLDQFGQQVARYNGIPILTPYSDNGGTDPIAFDEAGTGGGSTATSIYGLVLGDGLVSGIQSGGMDVRDLGELDTAPKLRTRVEWFAGMCIEHGRAAARLHSISNAAVTA